jgi:hypothetical protein
MNKHTVGSNAAVAAAAASTLSIDAAAVATATIAADAGGRGGGHAMDTNGTQKRKRKEWDENDDTNELKARVSLSALVKSQLESSVSNSSNSMLKCRRLQCSNWDRCPLSPAQRWYKKQKRVGA